jgi:CRP-like cAMP-binding protein
LAEVPGKKRKRHFAERDLSERPSKPLAALQLDPRRNALLVALPEDELSSLLPSLKPVRLARGEVLYEAGEKFRYGYFMTEGLVSLESVLRSGRTAEVTVLGREGLIGFVSILAVHSLPNRVVVEVPGSAFRIDAEALETARCRNKTLDLVLRRFVGPCGSRRCKRSPVIACTT